MGKSARNEIRKIKATRSNNLSVGLFIAGFFVPYVTFTTRSIEHLGLFSLGTAEDWKAGAFALGPTLVAWFLSLRLARSAVKTLEEIED